MKHAVELIEWEDHCSLRGHGWNELSEAEELKPSVVNSVGWVIIESEKFLVLVSHTSDNNEIDGDLCIIKSCIKRRIVLLKDKDD